ncbi:VCBS repeat-containing protein [Alteromonas sp. 1_MG-2023]|uniref:FG-GAP repeat domain-containing protein n=1 Tax=Alteromonas sp. 1_MG-2023 TaxID=3062669 RepID=UPI0026E23CB2|nr:VCBS repeat-containing protein [Alteromonas sp. 1_MG-2023]MDO6477562.1 VCBS repeat-containing protein [Alteromonas sp. 1_MG-2023]
MRILNIATLSLSSVALAFASAVHADMQSFTSVQPDMFNTKGSVSNAWGDFDNDGDLDLLVSIKGGEVRLYRNDEGKFTSVGESMGLPTSGVQIRGVSWGDYNKDGFLDILGGSNEFPFATRSYVWRNDGGKDFSEVAVDIGLSIHGRISRQSSWIDVDNDGDSDVYAANRVGANSLYLNDNGKFKSVPDTSHAYDIRATVGACWFDIDRDGDLDLFLANQSGSTDAVMLNENLVFTDIAAELGMDQSGRDKTEGGVGCAVGDYDNDGYFDLYVSTYGENLLYHNNADGTFTEVGKVMGVTEPDHTVSAEWGDYDNDGLLDLIAVGYHKVGGESVPFGKLYHNTGVGFEVDYRFPAITSAGDHGVVWIDFDNNGTLDLSVTDGYGDEGGHFVFSNSLSKSARERMISVLVLDKDGHYTQQGAEVRFYDSKDKILGSRIVSTGGGYNAQTAAPVYFALAELQPIKVKITFMGRKETLDVRVNPEDLNGEPLVVYRPK